MNTLSSLLLTSLLVCSVSLPNSQSTDMNSKHDEIPTVAFCEMVAHPQLYFDKTIRLTATLEPRTEGTTINDVRCVRSHDDQIGASFVKLDESESEKRNRDFALIRSGKAGHQPRVTVTGILRNASRKDFQWYRYRFDIIRIEKIGEDLTESIIPFSGELMAGHTYRATVHGDKEFGLTFVSPLRIPSHQAVRLEWTNLKEFRTLKTLRDRAQQQIVFRVTSDDVHQIDAQRWDRTFKLEILLIE